MRVALLVALLAAFGAGGRLELRFVVDDAFVVHELCAHGLLPDAAPDLVEAAEACQAFIAALGATHEVTQGHWQPPVFLKPGAQPGADVQRFIADVVASPAYALVRKQAERRAFACEMEWEADRERSEAIVAELTGLRFRGHYRVLVKHPAQAGGANYEGQRIIEWGGLEPWPHYTTVYMWHEVLHDQLPRDNLGHALVQLVADQELRCRLDPSARRDRYVGHPYLMLLTRRIQPYWEEYLREPARRIDRLYAALRQAGLH